jgi:hypothetical protein
MATAAVTYTFTNGTNADALQVNQNFSDILAFINASVVQTDGSTALASDAVTETKIASGAVSAAKIKSETWTSWTPVIKQGSYTLTGASNIACHYMQLGKTVIAKFHVSGLSAGSTAAGGITVSLPVTGKSAHGGSGHGSGELSYADSSLVYYYIPVMWYVGTTTAGARRQDIVETYYNGTTTNNRASFAMNNSGYVYGTIIYEAA